LVLPLRSDRGIAAASDESAGAIPWRANCPDVLAPAARETVRLAGQVMRNGQPQRGVSVKLLRGKAVFRAETPFTVVAEAITDEQGGYVVGGLRPGDCYRVELLLTGMAAPDWPYQSPYIRGVPADANGVIDVPEARLVSTDQSLAGTVVNLHGKPVAGATVGATLDRERALTPAPDAPPVWSKTDEDGYFQIRKLPDIPLELEVFSTNFADEGWPTYRSVRIRPEPNAQDIRIVIDPSTQTAVENLDKK